MQTQSEIKLKELISMLSPCKVGLGIYYQELLTFLSIIFSNMVALEIPNGPELNNLELQSFATSTPF